MDMDFKWGGDASIILSVNPVLGPKLPVQVPFTYTLVFRLSACQSLVAF